MLIILETTVQLNIEPTKSSSLELKTQFMRESLNPMMDALCKTLSQHKYKTVEQEDVFKAHLDTTLNNIMTEYDEGIKTRIIDFQVRESNTEENQTNTSYFISTQKEKMGLLKDKELMMEKKRKEANEAYQSRIENLKNTTFFLEREIERLLNDIKWFYQHQWFLLRDYPKELQQRFLLSEQLNYSEYEAFKAKKLELSENLSKSLIHAKRCQTAAHCFSGLALLSVSPIILAGISIAFIIFFSVLLEFAFKLAIIGLFYEFGVFVDPARQLVMNIGHLIQGFGPYLAIAGGALLLIAVGLYLYSAFQDSAFQDSAPLTIQDFSKRGDDNSKLHH